MLSNILAATALAQIWKHCCKGIFIIMHATGAGDCNGADPSFPGVTQSSASVQSSCSTNRCGAAPALQLNAPWQQMWQGAIQKEPPMLWGQTFFVHYEKPETWGESKQTNKLDRQARSQCDSVKIPAATGSTTKSQSTEPCGVPKAQPKEQQLNTRLSNLEKNENDDKRSKCISLEPRPSRTTVAIDDDCSGKGLVFQKNNWPDFDFSFLAQFERFETCTETEETERSYSQLPTTTCIFAQALALLEIKCLEVPGLWTAGDQNVHVQSLVLIVCENFHCNSFLLSAHHGFFGWFSAWSP